MGVLLSSSQEPGKKYTYTLNFCSDGGGAGEVDPNPTDPTDPDSGDIVPDPGTGGDSILNAPIKFVVTVDNWADQPINAPM